VDGGPGNDRLHSGPGTDTLTGGDGDDVLFMVVNDDKLDHADCGAGQDTVWVNADESDAKVNCETVKTVTITTP
jgi:Ca2+-binding RTX toxin-like protein